MTTETSGDVLLFHTVDDGEIAIVGGVIQLSGGLSSAVYLSLFGGNDEDDGRTGNRLQWWGNLTETEPEFQYRSKTQYLLKSIPAIPANLRKIEDAVKSDLAWMVKTEAATSVEVEATMPGINRIRIAVNIIADNRVHTIAFESNWKVV